MSRGQLRAKKGANRGRWKRRTSEPAKREHSPSHLGGAVSWRPRGAISTQVKGPFFQLEKEKGVQFWRSSPKRETQKRRKKKKDSFLETTSKKRASFWRAANLVIEAAGRKELSLTEKRAPAKEGFSPAFRGCTAHS